MVKRIYCTGRNRRAAAQFHKGYNLPLVALLNGSIFDFRTHGVHLPILILYGSVELFLFTFVVCLYSVVEQVQLDESRTCDSWNDFIDLPSDAIYENASISHEAINWD